MDHIIIKRDIGALGLSYVIVLKVHTGDSRRVTSRKKVSLPNGRDGGLASTSQLGHRTHELKQSRSINHCVIESPC